MLFRLKRFWFVLLVPLSILLTAISHRYSVVTERFFSRGLYRILTESYGRIFSLLPFSVAQFLIVLLPMLAAYYLFYVIWHMVKPTKTRKEQMIRLLANSSCVVGVVWFMFTVLCGLNYARESFASSSGLEIRQSSVAELVVLCEELVDRVNESGTHVNRDKNGLMVLSAKNDYALSQDAQRAYQAVGLEYPVLSGYCARAKPVLYSSLMSYINILGIYIPFTMEATVNVDVCDYKIPSAMTHELAHFKGFMREDEANFIAYIACMASGHPDFIYSGEMYALTYAANQLWEVSQSDFRRIMNGLSEDVKADRYANNVYWQQFEGRLAEVSNSVNDAYLKANRQSDGIQSYGRMVDLLLADYRKRHGE